MKVLSYAIDEVVGQSLQFADDDETVLFDSGFVRRAALLAKLCETIFGGKSDGKEKKESS